MIYYTYQNNSCSYKTIKYFYYLLTNQISYFSGTEITALAHQLGYDREVIRIWFCNKRQALKNTVRMMSKHIM